MGKTINGVVVTPRAFKEAIVAIVGRHPSGATLGMIAEELGPEHTTPEGHKALTKVLIGIRANQGLRLQHKRYIIPPETIFGSGGVTKGARYEGDVLKAMAELGGVVRRAELIWHFVGTTDAPYRQRPRNRRTTPITDIIDTHMTPTAIMDREATTKGIVKALQSLVEQGKVERRFALSFNTGPRMDGWYNLPAKERNSCILRGSALFHMMKTQRPWDHAFRQPHEYAPHEVSPIMVHEGIDKHLQRVAEACQEARLRRGLSIRQVMADPAVAASLRLWRKDCSLDIQRLRGDREAARAKDPSLPALDIDSAMEQLYEHFEMFVSVDTGFHSRRANMIAADCQFFTALGNLLQFDPVALSRGFLEPTEPIPT